MRAISSRSLFTSQFGLHRRCGGRRAPARILRREDDLAATHRGSQAILGHSQNNLCRVVSCRRRQMADMHRQRLWPGFHHLHVGFRRVGSQGDRQAGLAAIAAIKLRAPVYNHLRRVNIVQAEGTGRVALARAELWRRESVCPSTMIPVIYMLAQRDHVGTRDRLIFDQVRQNGICGRAIGTAFRRKQFHNYGVLPPSGGRRRSFQAQCQQSGDPGGQTHNSRYFMANLSFRSFSCDTIAAGREFRRVTQETGEAAANGQH